MRAIVLVSGGMDSCVTAALAREDGHELNFLHLNYGQRTEQRRIAGVSRTRRFLPAFPMRGEWSAPSRTLRPLAAAV